MQNYGHEEYNYGGGGDGTVDQSGGGRNLPQVPGARPMVDPSAQGEVDPSLYGAPKEATHKIRGKNDIIEYLFGNVDHELLTVKTFYFFFYSAFGSLFPLMGVYFKQMGMNAAQCGLLIGLRPFVEFLSAPFWGSLADRGPKTFYRWQKGKLILLASLSCWIIFTLPLGFFQPPGAKCMVWRNNSYWLDDAGQPTTRIKRSLDNTDFFEECNEEEDGDLEVAANVVFERLKRSTSVDNNDDNINQNRIFRVQRSNRMQRQTDTNFDGDDDPNAKNIDFRSIAKSNRPADVLEYKRFLKNEPLDETRPPKKAHSYTKVRAKPIRTKIMVERSIDDEDDIKVEDTEMYEGTIGKRKLMLLASRDDNELGEVEIINEEEGHHQPLVRRRRSMRGYRTPGGMSPMSVAFAANYDPIKHKGLVKPRYSNVVYRLSDIQKTFFLLFLLVIVGEFFAAPAITLADSAVITLLGEDADRYGNQRMFGSLGWGLTMFIVGIVLDHSTSFPDSRCEPDPKEKNYNVCFSIFSVLMGAALITATQINFKYDCNPPVPVVLKPETEPTREEQLQSQLSQQLHLPGLLDSADAPKPQPTEDKTKMFAQTMREIPEWVTVLKQFKDLKCMSFLFVAWFMGFGMGLIFSMLFWHLQDYDGSPTLFGVASVINHISEIFAYFFSFKLIRQIGHVKVLCLGLGGNVIRFLYISYLTNPWFVLPFELIQGITHAAVWAACCSYIAHNTPSQLRSSAQGVLQGLHHGLGRGCGAVIGGMFVASYGSTATFRIYGLLCAVVLAAFIFINFYRKDTGFVADLPQTEDPHQVAEATHLAPHGVPSNAIPRALSSSRLHEMAQEPSYGATYQTAGGNLGVPGGNQGGGNPTNPFLNSGGSGGGGGGTGSYNYGMTCKGEDEFIRRSFKIYSEVVGSEFDIVKPLPVVTHLHAQQPCTNPFHQHDYDW